jgi:catechol 2,3-dioxygenase-like lactoylglutathione lyase family enzyme
MNLNQVTVPASDVAASIAFYKKLGLILIVEDLPKYARFCCPDGGSTFSVHRSDRPTATANVVIYFECMDLDARVQDLKEKGVIFESEPQDQLWLWREAHLRDPDGSQICLYYAGENRLNPPWRIPPAH